MRSDVGAAGRSGKRNAADYDFRPAFHAGSSAAGLDSAGAAWLFFPMREEITGRDGGAVAEMQGLDGPFSFAERVLQRIWARGDFDRGRAITVEGEPVFISALGRWNRGGGPDFIGARLQIGERRVEGDVELHLRAADWNAHGHAADPHYARVALHVVLYPPAVPVTRGVDGRRIPILVLLPLLRRALEEYAEDDALERLSGRSVTEMRERLGLLEPAAQGQALADAATRRWREKVRFASLRLEQLGWEAACHHSALEVLGYRANRAPMLAVASAYGLDWWGVEDRTSAVAALVADGNTRWSQQAVRPANRPATRLAQYAAWVSRVPAWPSALEAVWSRRASAAVCGPRPDVNAGQPGVGRGSVAPQAWAFTPARRATLGLGELRRRLATEVAGSAVGGVRFDTLVCDGFLPLLAARRPDEGADAEACWWSWFAGDVPDSLAHLLPVLKVPCGGRAVVSHGLLQGLYGWLWSEQERETCDDRCPCRRGT
jgi:hypothetical protein